MKGGGLLATGSSSCVIKPNISCKGKKTKRNDKKISKIVFGKKSKEYSESEKRIDDIIKKIPDYKDWSLIYEQLCKPPSFDEAKKLDKGLYDCIGDPSIELHGNNNSKKRELFDKHSIMLIGDYGGETLEKYFEHQFDNPDENIKNIEIKFLDFMKKLDKLFNGLVQLKNNGISHLDVKPNNIVLKDDSDHFRFIDFGLSAEYKNLKHFKQRAKNEANTKRIYLYYPPEFLFSQSPNKDLKIMKKKLEKSSFEDFRNHANTYKSIQNIFNRDPKRSFISIINNYLDGKWNSKFNEIIKKIDVYSLGIMIPILFYNNDLLDRLNESIMLTNFFELFNLMISSYWYARIDIENAYILYKGLIEKFSKKTTKKKTLKKSVKKKKKKSKKNDI
tara:strand:- start:454 stop:1620 length:1167 start_codon:yes stop_codon:yes gene_type:complete